MAAASTASVAKVSRISRDTIMVTVSNTNNIKILDTQKSTILQGHEWTHPLITAFVDIAQSLDGVGEHVTFCRTSDATTRGCFGDYIMERFFIWISKKKAANQYEVRIFVSEYYKGEVNLDVLQKTVKSFVVGVLAPQDAATRSVLSLLGLDSLLPETGAAEEKKNSPGQSASAAAAAASST